MNFPLALNDRIHASEESVTVFTTPDDYQNLEQWS